MIESYNLFTLIQLLLSVFSLFTVFVFYRTKKNLVSLTSDKNPLATANNYLQNKFQLSAQNINNHKLSERISACNVKAPVAGVISEISLMENDTKLPTLAKEAEERSSAFINNLLINENKKSRQKSDLHEVLNTCIDLLKFQSSKKSQKITLKGDKLQVMFYREKIYRVFINLINNAIKFSQKNSTINIEFSVAGDEVIISVQDFGIGIPDNLKDCIFNDVANCKRLGTANEESFGLGLAITKQIVDDHDGRIWFESEQLQGCTFFVALPLIA